VRTDYRWGAGDAALYRKYATELVALAPDSSCGWWPSCGCAADPPHRADRVHAALDRSRSALSQPWSARRQHDWFFISIQLLCKWLDAQADRAPVTRAAILLDPTVVSGARQLEVSSLRRMFGVELSRSTCMTPTCWSAASRHSRTRRMAADSDVELAGNNPSRPDPNPSGPHRLPASIPLPFRDRRRPISYDPFFSTIPTRRRLRQSHPQGANQPTSGTAPSRYEMAINLTTRRSSV